MFKICYDGPLSNVINAVKDFSDYSWNDGLRGACFGGRLDIIKYCIENGATDLNGGLFFACRHGNRLNIDIMIIHGAKDWNKGLIGACSGPLRPEYGYSASRMKIIELMISNGATDFNSGLLASCKSGNYRIVQLMISKGASNFNEGLDECIIRNNTKAAKILVYNGCITGTIGAGTKNCKFLKKYIGKRNKILMPRLLSELVNRDISSVIMKYLGPAGPQRGPKKKGP